MRKPAVTPDSVLHRGAAAPFRIAMGLVLAASAGMMLWSVDNHSVSFAGELGRNAAPKTVITLEDRVAPLSTELARVKADTARLRQGQSDNRVDLSHLRANLANAEIGL